MGGDCSGDCGGDCGGSCCGDCGGDCGGDCSRVLLNVKAEMTRVVIQLVAEVAEMQ